MAHDPVSIEEMIYLTEQEIKTNPALSHAYTSHMLDETETHILMKFLIKGSAPIERWIPRFECPYTTEREQHEQRTQLRT